MRPPASANAAAAPAVRGIALVTIVSFAFRVATAVFVFQPGYTDAYYYANVASRLARGLGLTADFIWSPIELGAIPVASHVFWMPMATVLQAIGIVPLAGVLGDFRAGQAVIIAVASLLPLLAYLAARGHDAGESASLIAAAVVGLGGLFAPAWVSVDNFAPAALLGTLFFIAYRYAAAGVVRAGVIAGVLVGLLYLTRAEGALFGVALLVLAARRTARGAALAGSAIALAMGGIWFARDLAAGPGSDALARTFLLVRYDQFFAIASPSLDAFVRAWPDALASKLGALVSNAGTLLFAYGLVLALPLAFGVRRLSSRPDVRAWVGLAILIFAAQSLLWTLHSTRGSYFHSLAAFFPFGVAIATRGAERLLAGRTRGIVAAWTWATLLLIAVLSAGAVSQWDAAFNGAMRVRAAAVPSVPAGPFLAIDASAWRWLSGHPVFVTPSDGVEAAGCVVALSGATSVVLEEAHFRAYEDLYAGRSRPSWLGAPLEVQGVKIFAVVAPPDVICAWER